MKETLTLWQRCEALGPRLYETISLQRTESKHLPYGPCWVIEIHKMGKVYIYGGGIISKCHEFLAIAIVEKIEKLNRSQQDETDGQHNDPNFKGANGDPLPIEGPTMQQRKDLYFAMQKAENPRGFEIIRQGIGSPIFLRGNGGFVLFDLYADDQDFKFVSHGPTFWEAWSIVGLDQEPKAFPPCTHSGLETMPYCQRCSPWLFECTEATTEPTLEQRIGLHEHCVKMGSGRRGNYYLSIDGTPKASVKIDGVDNDWWQMGPANDYYFQACGGFTFWDACKLVGFDPRPLLKSNPSTPTQEELSCEVTRLSKVPVHTIVNGWSRIQVYDCIRFQNHGSDYFKIYRNQESHEPFATWKFESNIYTFKEVQGLFAFEPLPIPDRLADPTYVVEAPSEFVSIPRAEWDEMRVAFEVLAKSFNHPVQPVPFEV